MRVLVLGAPGRVGAAALSACLENGHLVTALVRSFSRLPEELRSHPRLRVLKGDVMSHISLVNAIRDQDAIIEATAYAPGLADSSETTIPRVFRAILDVQASRKLRVSGGNRSNEMSGNGKKICYRQQQPIKLWVLSGPALKVIPRTTKDVILGRDVVPIHPKYYKNYAFLREEAQDVDWRLRPPGRIETGEVRVLLYECR